MPKIIEKIENWNELTPEEKLALIEEMDDNTPTLEDEINRYKNAVTKANKEVADLKRNSKQALSEEEKKALEALENLEKLQSENAALKKESQVRLFTSKGYTPEQALAKVEALAAGDLEKSLEIDEQHLENYKKQLQKELTNNTPPPGVGNKDKIVTKEDFQKLSPNERLDFSQKNPEVYRSLYEN